MSTKVSSIRARLGWLLAGMLLLAIFGGLAASWWLGGQLVAPAQHAVPLPIDFPAQAVTIESPNGPLAAWWAPGEPGSPAVLLLHAVRGDRATMLSRARLLLDHGFSVLLLDMQAHGESPGSAITMGWRESRDARAGLAWLRRASPGSRVGAIGCSLGGAAILLGPQPAGFDAVVLEAVYPRLRRAVENRIRLRLGPLAPALTPLLLFQLKPRLGIDPAAIQPVDGIAGLEAPVLVVAGSEDRHTALSESQELYAAAREPKRLWIVSGAAHQDFLAFDADGYRREVVTFLAYHLRPAPNPPLQRTPARSLPWDPLTMIDRALGLESAGESLALWRELVAETPPELRRARALDSDSVDCKPHELVVWVDARSGIWRAFGPARVMTCEKVDTEERAAIRNALIDLIAEEPEGSAFACWVGRTRPTTELTRRTALNERERVLAGLRQRLPSLEVGDYGCDYASAESRRRGGTRR